jgi:hypothetical protein
VTGGGMTELDPQERFYQLLSFLKDPQAYQHTTVFLELPIWLEGRQQDAGEVNDFLQEAIEIMESGMFRNGCLKGNQKTPDIPIKRIENFILQIAAAVHLANLHRANSPEFQFNDFDRRPRLYDELKKTCDDLGEAYKKWVGIVLKSKLITPDRLGFGKKNLEFIEKINQLQHEGKIKEIDPYIKNHPIRERVGHKLNKLMAESLSEAYKREEMSFSLTDELILIFAKHFSEAKEEQQISLIATHITNLLKKYSGKKERELLWHDAIRKRLTATK